MGTITTQRNACMQGSEREYVETRMF